MQGKGLSLRLSLLALVVVLIFGSLGGLTLARDAFDNDYEDCPASTRLDAVGGLTIDRTDEDDEIRISWDALDTTVLSSLGPNGYRARLTIIVDGEDARNVALGDTSLVVDDIDFAEDLTVSMAITLGDFVISDIREADFTSGLPGPRFSADIWVSNNTINTGAATEVSDDLQNIVPPEGLAEADEAADKAEFALLLRTTSLTGTARQAPIDAFNAAADGADGAPARSDAIGVLAAEDAQTNGPSDADRTSLRVAEAEKIVDADDEPQTVGSSSDLKDLGTFYYLGFNDLFDNWFVATKGAATVDQRPSDARFRVGLRHGNDALVAGDADFENYRIVIEDSSGDLLGYQAETVEASRTYRGNKIVFSSNTPDPTTEESPRVSASLAASLDVDEIGTVRNVSNIRLSNRVTDNGAVDPYYERTWEDFLRPSTLKGNLSHGNVGFSHSAANLFPAVGVVYADSPVEYFDFPSDVFESDGRYTIKAWAEDGDGTRISPQTSIVLGTQEQQSATGTDAGYTGYTRGIRVFAEQAGNSLTVYGFSIQDE